MADVKTFLLASLKSSKNDRFHLLWLTIKTLLVAASGEITRLISHDRTRPMNTDHPAQNRWPPKMAATLRSCAQDLLTAFLITGVAVGGSSGIDALTHEAAPQQNGNSLTITCKGELPDGFPRRISHSNSNTTIFPISSCDVGLVDVTSKTGMKADAPVIEPTETKYKYQLIVTEDSEGIYITRDNRKHSFDGNEFWTFGLGSS
jgi:hypothetical protein